MGWLSIGLSVGKFLLKYWPYVAIAALVGWLYFEHTHKVSAESNLATAVQVNKENAQTLLTLQKRYEISQKEIASEHKRELEREKELESLTNDIDKMRNADKVVDPFFDDLSVRLHGNPHQD